MGVTAVVNQKGGVGKTTVSLGLAAAAAAAGRDVVVVDLDPQANSTTGLGVWDAPSTIDAALDAERPGSLREVVIDSSWTMEPMRSTVRVVPSSPRLAQREHQLAMDVIGAQDRLAVALSGLVDEVDDVIIDCPPSLGLLTVNALFAADSVLIVAEPAAWSSDGVEQILLNVSRIAERRGGRPAVAGIVVNRLGRTRDAAYWAGQLAETHPTLVVEPSIRLRAAVAEAAAQSLPIHALHRDGAAEAADEFDRLAARLGLRPELPPTAPGQTDPAGSTGTAQTAVDSTTVTPSGNDADVVDRPHDVLSAGTGSTVPGSSATGEQ